jgi:hypothetical protein
MDAEVFQLTVIEEPERAPGLSILTPSSKPCKNGGTKRKCQPILHAPNGDGADEFAPGHQSIHCGGWEAHSAGGKRTAPAELADRQLASTATETAIATATAKNSRRRVLTDCRE